MSRARDSSFSTIRHSDKNLSFHISRGKFIDPQRKAWYVPESAKKTGRFDIQAKWRDFPAVSGGGDQNIQWVMYDKGLKRKQPTLHRRLFKDLDPKSRILGRLDITKRQRQNTLLVESLNKINKDLDEFLRTPELDADGIPVVDEKTGETRLVLRTPDNQLRAAHFAIRDALQAAGVQVGPNYIQVIRNFTVPQSQEVVRNVADVIIADPGADSAVVRQRAAAVPLMNALRDADELEDPADQKALADEAIDRKLVEADDWKGAGFPARYFSPQQYKADRGQLRAFAVRRLREVLAPQTKVLTVYGSPTWRLGTYFAMGHWLDLDRLRFIHDTNPEIRAQVAGVVSPFAPAPADIPVLLGSAAVRPAGFTAVGDPFAALGEPQLGVARSAPARRDVPAAEVEPSAADIRVQAALEKRRRLLDIARIAQAAPLARGDDRAITIRTALVQDGELSVREAEAFMKREGYPQ